MPSCTFILNRLTMSSVITPAGWFSAFSGDGAHRNNPDSQNVPNNGPIPVGSYYIVDRESGGLLGAVRDWTLDRDKWFALYRDDGTIDDATFVQSVARGQFRLHPKGPLGISKGCVVLNDPHQFTTLRKFLLSTPATMVPGTSLKTYGTLDVALLASDTKPTPRVLGTETRYA